MQNKIQPAADFFDPQIASNDNGGPNIILSNNNKTARTAILNYGLSTGWHQVRGNKVLNSEGIYQSTIIFEEYGTGGNLFIGFANPSVNETPSCLHMQKNTYLLFVFDCSLYQHGEKHKENYAKIKEGDILTIIYDSFKQTISFQHNGEDKGIAFEQVQLPLVLISDMYTTDYQISLLE